MMKTIKPCGSSNGGFRRIVAPFPKITLLVGDRVRIDERHFLWDVRGVTENFVVLTQHAQFHETGVTWHTIIDWRNGIYGPVNTVGQGWDTDNNLEELLVSLENGSLEVSSRVRVELQSVALASTGGCSRDHSGD